MEWMQDSDCGQKMEGKWAITECGFRVDHVFPNRMLLEAHVACSCSPLSYTKCQ